MIGSEGEKAALLGNDNDSFINEHNIRFSSTASIASSSETAHARLISPLFSRRSIVTHLNIGRKHYFQSLFFTLNDIKGWKLFLYAIPAYLLTRLAFTLLYFAGGHESITNIAEKDNFQFFMNCFYFTFQVGMTIGFGFWSPCDNWSNIVVSTQTFFDMVLVAAMSAFILAKVSRSTLLSSHFKFSRVMCLSKEQPIPQLLMRAFYYKRVLAKPTVRAFLLIEEEINSVYHNLLRKPINQADEDAHISLDTIHDVYATSTHTWQLHELTCEVGVREGSIHNVEPPSPYLPFPFVVSVAIDSTSPLLPFFEGNRRFDPFEIIFVIEGRDEAISQSTQARFSYTREDLVSNAHFAEMMSLKPKKNQNETLVYSMNPILIDAVEYE